MNKSLLVLLGVFTSCSVFASGFKPLIGSDWALKNPNKLPFGRCLVTADAYLYSGQLDPVPFVGGGVIGSGATHLASGGRSKNLYMSCVSYKEGLAYKIPLSLPAIYQIPDFALSWRWLFLEFSPQTLAGKKLHEVFGGYNGVQGDLGLGILSASGSYSTNANGVAIKTHAKVGKADSDNEGSSVGFALGLGYMRFSVGHEENLKELPYTDPYMLTKNTQGFDVSSKSPLSVNASNQVGIELKDKSFAMFYKTTFLVNGFQSGQVLAEDGSQLFFSYGDSSALSYQGNKYFYHEVGKTIGYRELNNSNDVDYVSLGDLEFVQD